MNARMTLVGMTNQLSYLNQPLNNKWVLENKRFDKEVLLSTIILRGAQFEPLFSTPDFFLQMSDSWWMAHRRTFEKWFDDFDIAYEPLENYNRTEEHTYSKDTTEDTVKNSTNTLESAHNETLNNTRKVDSDTTDTGTSVLDGTVASTENREDLGHDKVLTGGSTETGNSDVNKITQEENGQEKINELESVSGMNSSALVTNLQNLATKNPVTNTTTEKKGTDGDHASEYEKKIVYDKQNEHTAGTEKVTANIKTDNSDVYNGKSVVDATTKDDQISGGNASHTIIDNGTENLVGKEKLKENIHTTGNIGVTTSQQMLKSDLEVQLWNEYTHIADLFINDLCVRVY